MKRKRITILGLPRAGKTILITSLIKMLREGDERLADAFQAQGYRVLADREQPPKGVDEFAYDEFVANYQKSDEERSWPPSTTSLSEYHLRVRLLDRDTAVEKQEFILELVDYPGERLLDLPMSRLDFAAWSDSVISHAKTPYRQPLSGQEWLSFAENEATWQGEEPAKLEQAVALYKSYLEHCSREELCWIQPQGLLDPKLLLGKQEDFCPIPKKVREKFPNTLKTLNKRYQTYVDQNVRFCKEKLVNCQLVVVVVDVLRILRRGEDLYNDVYGFYQELVPSFTFTRPKGLLDRFLVSPIEKIAFVATKADEATSDNRANLGELLKELFRLWETLIPCGKSAFLHCAAHRSTEDTQGNLKRADGSPGVIPTLRGVRLDQIEKGVQNYFPGSVPPHFKGKCGRFVDMKAPFPSVLPGRMEALMGKGVDHINLDRVFWHLMSHDL